MAIFLGKTLINPFGFGASITVFFVVSMGDLLDPIDVGT